MIEIIRVRIFLTEHEFLQLLKAEQSKLYRIALAILGNEQDAWDSLQQAAENAWNKRNTLRNGPVVFPA
jgi:DNA-directed RNA polymerase specialized sigma24 family protein